jgi:glycosyltransferase involved in cell wall biosynthesis
MKIVQITPSFYPAHVYGGPTVTVYRRCHYLREIGCEVRVLTTDADGLARVLDVEKNQEVEAANGLRIRYCRRLMRHSVSLTLLRLLPSYIRWADVVHLTAVYSFPTIPTLLVCKILGKPVVWSPRGALQRWEGSTRLWAKSVWEWVCRRVAPQQCILDVTSEEEARASLERFPGIEITVIPNGIEIPEQVTHIPGKGIFRLLYIGRLHPIKGIENLLSACKMLNDSSDIPWSLTIAGAGDPHYTEALRTYIAKLALIPQVQMVGEVIGIAKKQIFENTDISIVPSYTENFGIVIAEALAHGIPVIASRGTPWKRVEEIGCGLWVANEPESLVEAIEQMSRTPLREMGLRGREWMQREFSWPLIAQKMVQVYEILVQGSAQLQTASDS